ncbi:hypothetical protein ETR_09920 [Erwinia tracheiphila PSU-1]|nr:hypothetical protein ETR_09920 [Erwinia tracheiphila PSU-1]
MTAAQADPVEGGGYFFDYGQAASRAQPRTPSYVGGNYRRDRP